MRYLVATDGSEESDRAVEYATTHAVALDAALEIVHVVPSPADPEREGTADDTHDAVDEAEATLERARSLAVDAAAERGADIPIRTEFRIGRPTNAIVDYADESGADAIYLGHHVRPKQREAVVGSVAKSILDKAIVPVTIVR